VLFRSILDALLNARCYKQAWEEDAVWQELERLSGRQLDPDCVAAVLDNKAAIQDIQQRWPAR
jgi:response regulator RpfG family c-di-GMP phosphodiesterase